jgi:copper chaperone CopZ
VDLKVDGIISIEDLNTLLLEIRALPGVADVQGGVGIVQVTFDPALLSRQKIVDLITGRGYTVKE